MSSSNLLKEHTGFLFLHLPFKLKKKIKKAMEHGPLAN